ncbi:S10 family peptidase [Pseudocolwellia agarivorans]|mgnify:CR=1 FL=1|uniref:S10 family peptidase n=1 Tax=Pseudocolwellia agarivorans TaxID=1911682 RepID=UPI000987300B|nr:hypothetical protein [Pseudocolwellia agarivorans]
MKYFFNFNKTIVCTLISGLMFCSNVMAANESSAEIKPKSFVSEHRIEAGGKTIRYIATAGETLLRDSSGKPTAAIWATSFVKKDAKKENRPVMFVYNGGPGSAAAILQIGLLGPKIVNRPDSPKGDDGAAPYSIIDNPHSILDLTDIVFVDPVGTGFSRVLGDASNKDFWGTASDARSMGDFINNWITINQRWNSPKHILGLSYGTIRAVSTADYLSAAYGMDLNGLILMGTAIDLGGLASVDNNILAYIGYMPTMATIAHYHGKAGVGKTLEAFAKEAREFTIKEYVPALLLGEMMPAEERDKVAERFAYFTGLSKKYILQSNLRVLVPRFRKELLRDEGLTIGYSDGRYTGQEFDNAADEPVMGDPSNYRELSMYNAGYNHYLAEIGVKMDTPYKLVNYNVGKNWDWQPDMKAFTDPQRYRVARRSLVSEVASKLGSLMRKNEDLDVMVASGLYDIITPFFNTERSFANNGIVLDRVNINYYESGHKIWIDTKSREKLSNDIRQFFLSQK